MSLKPVNCVLFIFIFMSSFFAQAIRCPVVDQMTPSDWPQAYLDIKVSGQRVVSAEYISFFPKEKDNFEEQKELIFSLKEKNRGGFQVISCLDENEGDQNSGKLSSLCNKVQNPSIDRIWMSLTFSKVMPGEFFVEIFQKDSENTAIRRISLQSCL